MTPLVARWHVRHLARREIPLNRTPKSILARLALSSFVLLLLTGCVAIVPIDLTGTWRGELVWTSGPVGITSSFTLDLVHDSRDVTGTVTLIGPGSQPFELPIVSGRTQARILRLEASGTMDIISPPVDVQFHLEGDFDAEEISGTGTQTNDGRAYTFDWTADRISGPPESE